MEAHRFDEAHLPIPPSPVRFTERELELAHQLAALGIDWEPSPGMFVFDDGEHFFEPSPVQPNVYVILNYHLFAAAAGSVENLRRVWTWLPSWEEGRAWLRRHGKSDAEVLDRIRERVVDAGVPDREALYELMLATVRAGLEPSPVRK